MLGAIATRVPDVTLMVHECRDDTRVTPEMNAAEYPSAGAPPRAALVPGTLRASLERRAASRSRLPLDVAVAQIVPLCVEVAEIHAAGYGLYLHPSNIVEAPDGGLAFARELATHMPVHPRDRACLAPETRPDQLNDARANVYAIAAIFYELLTGESVGQGMRRPTELVPGLPPVLETILSHALIVDPQHRPGDLNALAEALHQLARAGTVPPPPPSNPAAFTTPSVPVDVSFSLLPPAPAQSPVMIIPAQPAVNAYGVAVQAPESPRPNVNGYGVAVQPAAASPSSAPPSARGPLVQASAANAYGVVNVAPTSEGKPSSERTEQILELRAQLESDPRARYFVFKQGMDHGPFTALELVQHIDAHQFQDEDKLTDSIDRREGLIRDWPPFAQFAEHAKRQRELEERKKMIGRIAAAESKRSRSKAVLGGALLAAMLLGAGSWYQSQRGERDDEVEIKADDSTNVETDNDINVKNKKKGRRPKRSGSGATVASGQSCEAAIDSYNEIKEIGKGGQADITADQFGRVLNSGTYFSHCGVPNSMAVNICAAVQGGKAVGVTVRTQPHDSQKQACITKAVRNLSFPSHPKLDVTRTRFAAQ